MSEIKLINYNVAGIWGNKEKVFRFMKERSPEIICVQETHTTAEQAIRIKYPEYHAHAVGLDYRSNQSGVAIFSKEKPIRILDVPEEMNKQARIIAAEFKDLIVVNIYFPISKNEESFKNKIHRCYDILNLIQQLEKIGKPILQCGDYNISRFFVDHEARAQESQKRQKPGFFKEEQDLFKRIKTQFIKFTDVFDHLYTPESLVEHIDKKYGNTTFSKEGLRQDYILVSNDILPNVVSADIHFYSEPDEKGERLAYQNNSGDRHLPLEVVLKF